MNTPSPSEPNTRINHQKATCITGLAAALLMCAGCTSPGMKLDIRPKESSPTPQAKVRLQALDEAAAIAATSTTTSPIPKELLSIKPTPYRVGPQDILLVTVWDHPEITLPLGQYRTDSATGIVVDDFGEAYFPYVGPIKVAGNTVVEIRNILTERLASIIRKPQVDVKILSFRSKKVFVGGEVRNPATLDLTDVPLTLSEAISRAGGMPTTADDGRILLNRGGKTWTLDYQGSLSSGNQVGRLLLQDGDALYIPNTQDEPVYMLGEVLRPGTTARPHGRLSLARALSEVGGISGNNADARSVYVIRQGAKADEVDVFHLDARNPVSMVLADRFPLKPRDVVYVDAGTLGRFNRVMSLILPTVSAANGTISNMIYYHNAVVVR
ncbi:MAG: polysaccharide export protein [Holophagaceae bacterium]|nr:polysaccharide export protein [Holophagaceae bacterium]